jgi:hypothetical protein
MIRYETLRHRRGGVKALTGLSCREFEALYERFVPAWEEAERKRLSRSDRQRAIGGGRSYKLDLATYLLMTMMWVRLYLTTEVLGVLFGVDKSTVSRNGRRILAVLRQVSEGEIDWPDPPARGEGKDLAEALAAYPDLFAILDGTEQPVQRPKDPQRQRAFYSGKKKRHTIKNGIIVNEKGLIRAVTLSTPGSMHDLRHFRTSGVLDRIPREVGVLGDAGFDGLHHDLPEHSVATSHKARRNHPLTEDQRLINRELSCVRIVVENVLAQMKHFRSLAERFRHSLEIHDDLFIIVAAIVNRRTRRRLVWQIA